MALTVVTSTPSTVNPLRNLVITGDQYGNVTFTIEGNTVTVATATATTIQTAIGALVTAVNAGDRGPNIPGVI